MNEITAVIVDDERKAIDNLTFLLNEFCKNVTIVGTAQSVDKAIPVIELEKPDVVFLDIEMPQKSGFELFESTKHDFQTIFVTAYNQYAIKAFEVSAIDYLLKPVHIERLKEAVSRIIPKYTFHSSEKISTLEENLKSSKLSKISILHKDLYVNIEIANILCIEANQAYSMIYCTQNGELKEFIYSKNLNHFEKLLENNDEFIRSHRSWLINVNKVSSFSKTNLTVNIDKLTVPISRRKSTAFFEKMKLVNTNN